MASGVTKMPQRPEVVRVREPRLQSVGVAPESLHAVWPEVRPYVERLIEKTGARFLPEDVFTACKTQASQASLFFLEDEQGKRIAYFVAMVIPEAFRPTEKVLFIWLFGAMGKPTLSERRAAYAFVPQEFVRMARAVGAKRIRHEGIRKGWLRQDHGFDFRVYVMEKEL